MDSSLVAKEKEKMTQSLEEVGIPHESASIYADLLFSHEIDNSILKSPLLNETLLKDVGITKVGHVIKILQISKMSQGNIVQDFQYSSMDQPITLEEALTTNDSSPKDSSNHPKKVKKDLSGFGNEMQLENDDKERVQNEFVERSKYIPLRLTAKERKQLRLIEAALNVSEYTDKVDILSWEKKSKRAYEQIKDICAILCGLLIASDYQEGQKLLADRQFKDNEQFFQDVFEVGRRHKIMNPEKMRSEYGKLICLLQDAVSPEIRTLIEFNCVKPISTVYRFLKERDTLNLLMDPLVETATQEIIPEGKSRAEIQKNIKEKERSVDYLARKYSNSEISEEEVKLCLRSIGDNNSYLRDSRDPVDKMIQYLQTYFFPDREEPGYSLSISYGKGGARLNHDHTRQYNFVLQSLTLWRHIAHDMFKLWILAEEDLLDPKNPYRLSNTGQGLNRVQPAPRVGSEIHKILRKAQRTIGYWVGSSVVHLGDHNVPSAFHFIDKYTQVERIINPINLVIDQVDELMKDNNLASYINSTFGSAEKLKKDILVDFFRHGFDGSGFEWQDNFNFQKGPTIFSMRGVALMAD